MGTGKDLWNESETLGNKHDWAGFASLLASDAVYVGPGWRHEGKEAIRAYFEETDRTFPDQTTQTSLVVEEGDIVVAEWMYRGTHAGPMSMPDGTEIPPTGKTLELPGVTVCKIMDGKFANLHDYFDNAAGMTQLGLMPGT